VAAQSAPARAPGTTTSIPRAAGADGSGTTTTERAFRARAGVAFALPRFRPLALFRVPREDALVVFMSPPFVRTP
jgi:hypothetical protein